MRLSARARSPSSSGESRVSGWSRLPAAISPAAWLISVRGRARLRGEEDRGEEAQAEGDDERAGAQGEQGGAVAGPHRGGLLLQAAQRGLPGSRAKLDHSPPGSDAPGGDHEAHLGGVSPSDELDLGRAVAGERSPGTTSPYRAFVAVPSVRTRPSRSITRKELAGSQSRICAMCSLRRSTSSW